MQPRKLYKPRPPNLQGTLSYAKLEGDVVAVKDLDFAAYCRLRGLRGGDAVCTEGRNGNPRKYLLRFYDPEGTVEQLATDFLNSEAAQHADLVRRFKRVCRIVPEAEFNTSEFNWKSCNISKG